MQQGDDRMYNRTAGYAGFYNGTYLRSSYEFAYAYFLDKKGISWSYEEKSYELDDRIYKPDFFVYENNKLDHIVEIKPQRKYEVALTCKNKMLEKFGLEVIIITEKELTSIYKNEMPISFNKAKNMWIEEYETKTDSDQRGEKNPMYGVKHSAKTKKLISEKSKFRMSKQEYRDKVSKALKSFYANEENKSHLKKPRAKRIKLVCKLCGNEFVITEKQSETRSFCSIRCAGRSNIVHTREVNEEKIKNRMGEIKKLLLDWAYDNKQEILDCKFNKIKGLMSEFYDEVYKKTGVKDQRTISKAVFGEYIPNARKETLKFLKEYLSKENVCRTRDESTSFNAAKALEAEDKKPL